MGESREVPVRLEGWGVLQRCLGEGYALFRRRRGASMGYAAVFVLIGLVLEYGLLATDYALYYFILAGGFVLLAPFLFAAYYHLASAASKGEEDSGVMAALFRSPPAVFGLGLISSVLFLIWATDALIIYSVYFSFGPLPGLFTDPVTGSQAVEFVGYATLLGAVLSLIILFVTPFSIPRAIDQGSGFVDSIVFSVVCVWRNAWLLMPWVAMLGTVTLLTLLFALPLGLLLFPVLAYANFRVYRRLAAFRDGLPA